MHEIWLSCGESIIAAILFGLPTGFLIGRYCTLLEERRHTKERKDYLTLAYYGWEQMMSPNVVDDRKEGLFKSLSCPRWRRPGGNMWLTTDAALEAQRRLNEHQSLDLPASVPVERQPRLEPGLWREGA